MMRTPHVANRFAGFSFWNGHDLALNKMYENKNDRGITQAMAA